MRVRSSRLLLAALVLWNLAACAWFATSTLNNQRFWDERFSVSNVKKVLVEGTLRAENGWYGRLSYLPQAAVLGGVEAVDRLTGADRFELVKNNGDFTEPAYLISRLVSVVYGGGCLIVAFAIGRRIFGPEVALLGTALLATTPWVLRHFVTFKPDALLMLLVLATFYWSLEAAERPSLRGFALAGLGVGLAASAKFTGALAAFPVVTAALIASDRWRIGLGRLAAAGATSIAAFLVLHPDLGFYLHFLGRQERVYESKASHSFGSMLEGELSNLLHWSFHGPWLGALVIVAGGGLAVRLVRLWRAERTGTRARHLALFLSFPLGFSLAYALATTWPKGNNYLVLVPFTALGAAWLLATLWSSVAGRLPAPARRPALLLALAGLLAAELWPASVHIYSTTVPTTLERATARMLQLSPRPGQSRAVVESGAGAALELSTGSRDRYEVLMTREVAALGEIPEAELDLGDFELFPESRLRGSDAELYRRRVGRVDGRGVERVRSQWFRSTGPAWVLLVHPWFRQGQPLEIMWTTRTRTKGQLAGRLPPRVRAGEIVSIEARLPRHQRTLAGVVVGGRELPLAWNGCDADGERFASPRFVLPAARLRVRPVWTAEGGSGDPPRLVVVRWRASPRRGPG